MKKLIKSIIIVQVVFAQMLFAKDLVIDVSAPKSNQPNLKEARNGVPVVDIVKPNNKGLSHNKFTNYNVNKEGLILNNSNKSTVSTHLGGYIFGNPNLAGATAKTILNEVTSKNKTHLKGFTEVAGDRASVVVANPNGIYINGAGFINTHSAILAAGVPNVMDGEVANYMIRGGEIEVSGSGLNTTNVDRVKLYAKAIKLNAQIHAKDLEMIAGDSETWVDDENRVLFGIDSTALGGIYANKITLIGTEDGVGVNLPVEISSLDNLKISADGKIVLDKAVSSKDVDIKSFSDSVDLNTLYGDNINIEAKSLTNKKIIAAQKNIDIEAEDVINNSAIVTLNEDITITADTLTNYNTIYSNDSVNLYIKDKLLNETNSDMVDLANEKAIIFAKNDMNIQGDKDKINKTEEIVNKSADIQTKDGNIDIYANILTNKRALDYTNDAFVATSKVTDSIYFQEGKSYPSSGENGIINYFYITRGQDIHVYANNSEFYLVSDLAREPFSYHYVTTEVTMDKKVFYDNPRYKASVISSGKDLNLNITTIENQISNISAVRDIYFNSDQIINYHNTIHATNISFKTYHTKNGIKSAQNGTLRRGNTVLKSTGGDVWGDYDYGTYIANQNVEMGGVIVAGRDIKGTANSVINGTILDNQTIAPTITESKLDTIYASLELPTNKYGLFVAVDPDRNLDYLIESNPLYTNYDNYVGSSYFLEHMGYEGDRVAKRLGDAAYETKLISDEIFRMSGSRFLSFDYESENEQFVALMENGVNLGTLLDLELGKPLTKEQIASLSKDIVWLEERVVDNQRVLVPVLYLANSYEKPSGALIQAKSIDLNIEDKLVNSGTIKAKEQLNIGANSLVNSSGVILSNGKATLISNEDFINKNAGVIKANEIEIASLSGSIINETYSMQRKEDDSTHTNLGKTSSMEATSGDLILLAKEDIINKGSELKAKDNLLLQTESGDINLDAIRLENSHNSYFSGGFDKAKDVGYEVSTLRADNILMQSGNDITLEASKLSADGMINLNASNDINIEAVNSQYYRDFQTTKKGTFSKKTKRDMVYKESVNSAKLDAKDIVINANRSATIEAGELKAKENIVVNAKEGDLNIVAKEYKEGELHLSKKSSWGGLKKSVDLSSSDALKLNSALLKTEAANVVLTSGEDINILASKIDSGDLLLAKADNINILSSEELSKTEEFHKKSSFSPSFSGKTLTLAKETTTNDTNTISSQKSSNLSGRGVVLKADSEMTLIGSNIVGDSIVLNADDVNILSATQSSDSKHLSSTKKIGITLTLNSKEASIFAGSQIEKNKIDQGDTTQKASNIVANDIAISSGSHTNILASNIVADSSLAIFAGKNLNILSGEALEYKDEVHTSLKAGLSLGVKQHVTQGIKDVANTTRSIANSDNVAGAGFGVLRAVDTISSTLSTPVSAGLNAVAQMKENKSSSTSEYAQGSYIYAVDSAMLSASKDLNIKGSDIVVGNKLDIYANNLSMLASRQRANSNSSSSSLDLSVGLYGSNAGEVDLGVATQKQSFNSTTYKNSTILADNLNIEIDSDAKFEGANIDAKEIKATIGNNLILSSLQNTSSLKGDSKSLSVGSKSGGAGYGKDKNQREWVDKQTTIIGTDSVDITVKNNTHLKGAVLASSSNNLNLTTDTLTYENIYDKDKGSSYSAALGFNSSKENQAKMELSLSSRDKEQITYATLGEGVVQTNSNIADLNRNINNSQLITKDESSNLDIYLSNTSINKALNPNDTLDKWTQDAKDLGLNVRDEILNNLPSAKKEDANTIDNTIGKALDTAGEYSLGLIPSIDNQGGHITQIATQLFGDNRGIIETATMQELLDMGVDQKDIVQIEDGKYITNPYKTVIILKDEEAIRKEQDISNYNHAKIYLTQEQANSITHISTNGILSDLHSTRTGTKEQTAGASVVFINYNPSHGFVGDMIESTQDKLASHLVPYNSYASYLGTGGSKQSANSLLNLAEAKDGELVLVAHSQGTLQSFIAMHYIKPNLQNILKDKEDTTFKVGFYGSPVNGKDSIGLVRDLYINSPVYTNTDIKVSDYFRSSVNPGDPVAILGGNTAGINNKEGFWTNLLYSIKRGVPTLLNGGLEDNKNNPDKTSPHAGGACVIGCGDERITPDRDSFIDISGISKPLSEFYIERNLNSELAKYPQGEIE